MKQTNIFGKLAALKKAYTENLPIKISQIESLAIELNAQWNLERLIELHRLVHNLHGSAGTYGFNQLSEQAEELEKLLKNFLEETPPEPQKQKMQELIVKLKDIENIESINGAKISTESKKSALRNNQIFVLFKDKGIMASISSQLKTFSYDVTEGSSIEELAILTKEKWPRVVIVDFNFLNPEGVKKINEIKQKNKDLQTFAIFVVGPKGNFSERIIALRASGDAYFTLPLPMNEILEKIESIEGEDEVYTILIVEDEPDLAEYYATIINAAGMKAYVITHANQIDQALVELKPDLILMDIYMPDCNGLELAMLIRQQKIYESLPIVFLSSENDKNKQLEALSLGGDDFLLKNIEPDHLILALKNKAKRYKNLRSIITKDGLTGVYNHTSIQQILIAEIKRAGRIQMPLSVAMVDLDLFKRINDNYGHLMGDQVLKHFCLLLRKRLRDSDFIGRYGGEEFLIILPNTPLKSAKMVINELREKFSQTPFSSGDTVFHTTFSAGVSSYPDYQTAMELLKAADEALYKAKQEGSNRVC